MTNHNPSRPEAQTNTLVPLLVLRQDSFPTVRLVSAKIDLLLLRQPPTGEIIQKKNLRCQLGMTMFTIIAQTLDGIVVRIKRLTRSLVVIVEPISPLLLVRLYIVLTVAGLTVVGKTHQETMPSWNDTQSFDTSLIELANSGDNHFPVGDPSLEADYEVLSDTDTPEHVHCFFEGRRLLLGV